MKKIYLTSLAFFLLPLVSHAQTLQDFLINFTAFLGNVLVPFLFGLAFLFFVVNAIRFFVLGGASQEGRDKAKSLVIYSVIALVILLIFWGIVNIIAGSLGLGGCDAPASDYVIKDFVGPLQPACN